MSDIPPTARYHCHFLQVRESNHPNTALRDIQPERITQAITTMLSTKFTHFDSVDYLHTSADIAAYLEAAVENGDPELIAAALGDIARSRTISQLACPPA
ncbi:hypothetical protein BGC_45770 [Burkholderia sp. 3C]